MSIKLLAVAAMLGLVLATAMFGSASATWATPSGFLPGT
jgi:hypothetical protein